MIATGSLRATLQLTILSNSVDSSSTNLLQVGFQIWKNHIRNSFWMLISLFPNLVLKEQPLDFERTIFWRLTLTRFLNGLLWKNFSFILNLILKGRVSTCWPSPIFKGSFCRENYPIRSPRHNRARGWLTLFLSWLSRTKRRNCNKQHKTRNWFKSK